MANPAQFLLQLYQTAPLSSALSLAGQGLTQAQFQELLPIMTKFTQLYELDLSSNQLTSLAGLEQLHQLQRLDVGQNPLAPLNFLNTFQALPLLRHLTISFNTLEEEQICVTQLSQLLTLNNYTFTHGTNGTRLLNRPGYTHTEPGVTALTPPDINLVGADLEPVATLFDSIRNLVPADALSETKPEDDPAVRRRYDACQLETFESHINQTVVGLNDTLAKAPYATSPILRHAAILRAKQALFEVCAQALTSHARVVQPPMAECLTALRQAEGGVTQKYTELLTWLDREFELLNNQARLASEQVQQMKQASEAQARQYTAEMNNIRQRYQSEANLASIQAAKIQQTLEVDRATMSKEKKSLVSLIESLDAEVFQLKAAVQQSQENEQALHDQFLQREQYWMEREEQWKLRLQTPQLEYSGLGQVIEQVAQARAPPPAQETPPTNTAAPPIAAEPTPDFTQPIPSQPPPQQSQQQFQQPQQQQQFQSTTPPQLQPQPSPTATSQLAQAFFPSASTATPSTSHPSTSTQSLQSDPHATPFRSNTNTPFTATNAPLSSPAIPSHQYHPSTTSQALTLPNQQNATSQPPPAPASSVHAGRSMTLRQIKDLIREIYVSYDLLSKSLIDSHNVKQESQKETLLQHMYTFLNHKFGLKSLILDAANSLIRGLNQYSHDHTVAVFGGILRHTLDEEFRHTEEKTKKSVRELLKVYIQAKNPLKRDNIIQQMVEKRLKSTLNEEEYTDIISYMFAPVDRIPLTSTIRTLIQQQQAQEQAQAQQTKIVFPTAATAKGSPSKLAAANAAASAGKMAIKYTTFVNILLDFQLHVHRKFLEPFVQLFRQFDTMHSGLLSYEQFYKLVQLINPAHTDTEIRELMLKADPFKHNLISFSDCVLVLNADLKLLAVQHHHKKASSSGGGSGSYLMNGANEEKSATSPHPTTATAASSSNAFQTPSAGSFAQPQFQS